MILANYCDFSHFYDLFCNSSDFVVIFVDFKEDLRKNISEMPLDCEMTKDSGEHKFLTAIEVTQIVNLVIIPLFTV